MILSACRPFELLINRILTNKAWKRLCLPSKAKYSANCEEKSNLADLAVVGLGPSGITACLRAIKHGMKKVVGVDRLPAVGGTCVNFGCVPSKTLINFGHTYDQLKSGLIASQGIQTSDVKLDLEKMMCAKSKVMSGFSCTIEDIFQTVGIRIVRGTARFTGCKQLTVQGCDGSIKIVEAENIIIATGSTARDPGFEVDEVQIISSNGALSMKKIPKNLVVLGGGIISTELGFLWAKLGSKVTIVTGDSLIGIPIIDRDIRCQFQQILEQQGMKIMTNANVLCVQKCEKRVKIEVEDDRGENRQQLLCDVLLASAGRVPYTRGLNLDRVGIETDKSGHIPIHHNYQTCTPNIYAVGDVAPGPMTAHKAIEEGLLCVDGLCGLPTYLDVNNLPMAIYTYPALTSIGKTEEQLQNEGIPYKVSWSHMKTNLRAHIGMDTIGTAKALICPKSDQILGTHIIGENAEEMINEVVLAKQYGLTSDKVARVMHTHPSFSKLLKSLYGR